MLVSDIQRFCMHDGPGIRTTVFFKGCPLSCAWCHNPETQSYKKELLFYKNKCINCGGCFVCPSSAHQFKNGHTFSRSLCVGCGNCAAICPTNSLELCGKDMSADYLLSVIEKDVAFYGTLGGVTLSGGEPFMQGKDAVYLLKLCKEKGINTAVETCGYIDGALLEKAIPFTDLFLWDIKDTNPRRHKEYTGVSNEQILKNLFAADKNGAKIILRCILINNINTDKAHLSGILKIAKNLSNLEGVEFLPYHSFGISKETSLDKTPKGKKEWVPSKKTIYNAKEFMRSHNIIVL